MAKRKVESQTTNLTFDHYKSRIAMIYLCASRVLHIVEKFLTRATTLLQISSQPKVYTKHYGPPKLQESPFQEFQNSQLGSPMTK